MVHTAVPSRRGTGRTASLDPKEHAFYEVIEEVADAQQPIREVLDEIRDLLRQLVDQQTRTNRLLDRDE
jgi:signal transduction histidine kinase